MYYCKPFWVIGLLFIVLCQFAVGLSFGFCILDLDIGFCIDFVFAKRIWRLPKNLSYPRRPGLADSRIWLPEVDEKDLSRLVQSVLLSARLPFGFVCIACTAGNLQQVVGKEPLRQMSMAFAALRLPERGREVMHIWGA